MARSTPKPESPEALREQIRALSFEEAMRQLEAIVDRIESGEAGLEESLKEYERGVLLREHCREILARTEQRVSELKPPDPPAR
jgi:exodeoxyribonuclease VII small subunit